MAALSEAVEALEALPNRPESFAEYAVQKLVGHTLAWLSDPDGHARPVPGMCSNLEPDDRIKQLPPAPTVQAWFLIYELVRKAGDAAAAAAAADKFREAPFSFLRAMAARDALERRLNSRTLEGIVRLATTTAIGMAKSAQRKSAPTQEPDPLGLTGQITEELVAGYIRPTGRLDLEQGVGDATGEALLARGHKVQWLPDLSLGTAGVCAIAADPEAGVLYGGADPRCAARAMGW